MRLHYLVLILLSILLTNCTSYTGLGSQNSKAASYKAACPSWRFTLGCPLVSHNGVKVSREPELPWFNGVHVNGTFNVVVQSGHPDQKVALEGDSAIVAKTLVSVRDHKLFITLKSGYLYNNADKVDVIVTMGRLSSLHYAGPGEFMARNIDTGRLVVSGGNKGKMYLSGHVRTLDVAADRSIFINTENLIIAHALGASSRGNATITYNNNPDYTNQHPRESGAILRMNGLKAPPKCDPTITLCDRYTMLTETIRDDFNKSIFLPDIPNFKGAPVY